MMFMNTYEIDDAVERYLFRRQDERQMLTACQGEAFQRGQIQPGRLLNSLVGLAGGLDHRDEQVVLVVEVPVERLDRNAGILGDPVHRGAGEAVLEKTRKCGLEDHVAFVCHETRLGVVRGPGAHVVLLTFASP